MDERTAMSSRMTEGLLGSFPKICAAVKQLVLRLPDSVFEEIRASEYSIQIRVEGGVFESWRNRAMGARGIRVPARVEETWDTEMIAAALAHEVKHHLDWIRTTDRSAASVAEAFAEGRFHELSLDALEEGDDGSPPSLEEEMGCDDAAVEWGYRDDLIRGFERDLADGQGGDIDMPEDRRQEVRQRLERLRLPTED